MLIQLLKAILYMNTKSKRNPIHGLFPGRFGLNGVQQSVGLVGLASLHAQHHLDERCVKGAGDAGAHVPLVDHQVGAGDAAGGVAA